MIRRHLYLCLVLLLLFSCTRSAPILPAQGSGRADQNIILFVGDSLTAGYGLEPEQSYPSLIDTYWQTHGISYRARNAAISGDTTAGVLERIDALLTPDVDLVFLAIGANDGLRRVPEVEVRRNLNAILQIIRAKNIRVAIAGVKIPGLLRSGDTMPFEEIFVSIGKAEKIPVMPSLLKDVGGKGDLNQEDRIHPNAKGQRILARNVLKFLNPEWQFE